MTSNSLFAVFAGPMRDNGFYESGLVGAEQACREVAIELTCKERVGVGADVLAVATREAASSGAKLVLVHGGASDIAVQSVAPAFPDVQFLSTHGAQAGPNFCCFNVLQPESAFLAGALAALMTRSGVVGHLSGIRIPPGLRARAAWAQGVAMANPAARIVTCFCGTQDDNAVSARATSQLLDQGVDVLYTMLNFGRAGSIEVCRTRGVRQIGNVIDWCAVHPDVFIGSAVADHGTMVRQWVREACDGRFPPGEVRWLGMENPQAVRLVMAPVVPDDVKRRVNELGQAVLAGEIELASEYSGPEFSFAE